MPWKECDRMSLKREFIEFVSPEDRNISLLCQRFGVSRKTGYKWINRYEVEGIDGLQDQSRRPHSNPLQTPPEIENLVLSVRQQYPWGGRKIRMYLKAKGATDLPAPSTITAILRRHGYVSPQATKAAEHWCRFERQSPNELWQMDFKGHFAMAYGRCHPLTILDDHSRFCVGLSACNDERRETVQERLTMTFRRYGLPWQMNMDNGSPWGAEPRGNYTRLSLWLIRLGIMVSHSAPSHPQTNGKDERFHRTLKAEVLQRNWYRDSRAAQESFDAWLPVYNFERPHEALDDSVPASRYRFSTRPFPEAMPEITYGPDDEVRRIDSSGLLWYKGRRIRMGKALQKEYVAVRPTSEDGVVDVYFVRQKMKTINLAQVPKNSCI